MIPGSKIIENAVVLLLVAIGFLAACDDAGSSRLATDPALWISPNVTKIEPPSRILFVGNSFTYYNGGIDQHLRAMLSAENPEQTIHIESLTRPNETVAGHLANIATDHKIREGFWDVVILQPASHEATQHSDLDSFGEIVTEFVSEARSSNTDIALFMTWPYLSNPSMIGALQKNFVYAGNSNSVIVIPVGLAFDRVSHTRRSAVLYSDDRHPSLYGTYLAACVIYASLFGRSPVGNPYNAGLPANDANELQKEAWRLTQDFFGPD